MDFYVWGVVKAKVYEAQINTCEQLVQRINDAFAAIRENEKDINNAIESIFVRYQSCILNNGRHFEMLLH